MKIDLSQLRTALFRVSEEAMVEARQGCHFAALASLAPLQRSINEQPPREIERSPYRWQGQRPQPLQPAVDSGAYRAAWQVAKSADGAELFNPLPYAGEIERGAPPQEVPLQTLLDWAMRKVRGDAPLYAAARRPRKKPTKRRKSAAPTSRKKAASANPRRKASGKKPAHPEPASAEGDRTELALALALRAQKAIRRYGKQARSPLLRTLPAMQRILRRELDRAAARWARR